MKKILLSLLPLASVALTVNAQAQIGWTLNQCRKHWGHESRDNGSYSFGSQHAGIQERVTLDAQGKVNDVTYTSNGGGRWDSKPSLLDIPRLLATEVGVVWGKDPDPPSGTGEYFLGKKDGAEVVHARYHAGNLGDSLQVLPIGSLFFPPPISKSDTDWARANAARIEAEKKAKAAAGPTKEESERAAHDAEIRANNDRVLSPPTPTVRMSDAEIKALLIGTWTGTGEEGWTYTFTPDGRWLTADPRYPGATDAEGNRWDIKDGELIEIRPEPEAARPYRILFLTEHECLLHWRHHGGGYWLWTR
jgi:hypothetical protein